MNRASVFNRTRTAGRGIDADRPSSGAMANLRRSRALHERGNALIKQDKSADSIPILIKALALTPDSQNVRRSLALAYLNSGNKHEALREYLEISTRFPESSVAHSDLASMLHAAGNDSLAFKSIDRALALDPGNLLAMINLAEILKNLGNWSDARDVYAAALTLSPDSHKIRMQYGMTMIGLGEWSKGWPDYEHREFTEGVNVHTETPTAPRWDGRASITGKTVMIMHEQGFGDSIMCVRFARDLAARGARVHMRTPAPLVSLLSQAPGVSACSAAGSELPPHDYYVPLMSLPACLQLDRQQLDGEPYLVPRGECPTHIAALLPRDGIPTVALSWQGNPRHLNDRRRSINGALLKPLLQVPGIRFVAMQKIPTVQELLPTEMQQQLIDLGDACADFVESAHAMRRVDLVVTVDTAVAHLAGATGAPTLMCLPFTPDYRWELNSTTTPWYRNMTLLRQPEAFDWQAVLDDVRFRVEALR